MFWRQFVGNCVAKKRIPQTWNNRLQARITQPSPISNQLSVHTSNTAIFTFKNTFFRRMHAIAGKIANDGITYLPYYDVMSWLPAGGVETPDIFFKQECTKPILWAHTILCVQSKTRRQNMSEIRFKNQNFYQSRKINHICVQYIFTMTTKILG